MEQKVVYPVLISKSRETTMMISRFLTTFLLSCLLVPPVAAGLEDADNRETARLYFEEIINQQRVELIPFLISDDFVRFNNSVLP